MDIEIIKKHYKNEADFFAETDTNYRRESFFGEGRCAVLVRKTMYEQLYSLSQGKSLDWIFYQ